MQNKLEKIKQEIIEALGKAQNSELVKDLENQYLGRKGEFTTFLKKIKELDANDRKEIGRLANEAKNEIVAKFDEVKRVINPDKTEESDFDISLPGKHRNQGHLHPITKIWNEITDLFSSMGFMVLDGPELESDFFNFEALNIPSAHPARDIQDTFYIDKKNKDGEYDLLMRTHTSPVQIRAMRQFGAPLRCVVPGRVFRNEATDASHDITFYQLEGLMIDENISIANTVAVIREMLSGIFERDVKVRLRPGYFPFVEPGFEVDMSCMICGGKSCPSCKHTGWLEMIGAGMVHPRVLEFGGIDPIKYSGFAFGIGLTRLAMMKYGINDIRLFNSGDIRFLRQF